VEEVEALIRQRVADCVKALRAKDIDGVMTLYAPNLESSRTLRPPPAPNFTDLDGGRRNPAAISALDAGRTCHQGCRMR
jgi:hypothetical protein